MEATTGNEVEGKREEGHILLRPTYTSLHTLEGISVDIVTGGHHLQTRAFFYFLLPVLPI
jgi:hypothetical protein